MQILQGKSVSQGIAMGPVIVWQKKKFINECKQTVDPKVELARLEQAMELSKAQLLQYQQESTLGEIFESQSMLLEDDGFVGQMRELIGAKHVSAEDAVQQVCDKVVDMFIEMEDEYMRERRADILDITEQLLQNLNGQKLELPDIVTPSIILAQNLSPSDTVQFDSSKVLALATAQGTANSHASILARSMGIPMLVGVDLKCVPAKTGVGTHEDVSGQQEKSDFAIVDALSGQLILNPDEKTIEDYHRKIKQEQEKKESLQSFKTLENIAQQNTKIHICANVGNAAQVKDALENGADGIGLFRSEYLYLGRKRIPSEEEQYEEYKRAVIAMEGKRVIIRTLDIGADKQLEYLQLEQEENPALGFRGIRVCLRRQDIFRTQLRALFRAAVHGNLAIMYPMITSVEEVVQITKIVRDVANELDEQGISYQIPSQGIMIETPAAAMISDELAKLVDFFSIGTNDLTQYTLAMDRQNGSLDEFYNPHHKAILKMIQMVTENAHKAGKWVGICGELAGDTTLMENFVCMGVDELSVAPGKVPECKKMLQEK